MTTAVDHIKANLIGYALPVVAMLFWGGFVALMDTKHDAKGSSEAVKVEALQAVEVSKEEVLTAVQAAELRQLKRELRTVKDRLRLAPNSEYSASRQAEVDFLTDQITELEK